MSKYYVEYGALQANGKRLIECETSALDAKKITEDFAREIADALNGREAWKHERKPITDGHAVGNLAAMREALEHVEKLAREFAAGNYYVSDFPKMLIDAIRPALSEPPRNCDVGTVEEQCERYRATGETHHTLTLVNALTWAQMQYHRTSEKAAYGAFKEGDNHDRHTEALRRREVCN